MAEEKDDVPMNKEDGLQRWRKEMEIRFLKGEDADFDYKAVDESTEFDDRSIEERDQEEKWFDEEEPAWAEEETNDENVDVNRSLTGETGVQDY